MEAWLNNEITASQLKEKLSTGKPIILDVREPIEYHTFNIGGQNIPLGNLSKQLHTLKHQQAEELIVICQRGIRSETACRLLVKHGIKNVKNLTGGLLAYRRLSP